VKYRASRSPGNFDFRGTEGSNRTGDAEYGIPPKKSCLNVDRYEPTIVPLVTVTRGEVAVTTDKRPNKMYRDSDILTEQKTRNAWEKAVTVICHRIQYIILPSLAADFLQSKDNGTFPIYNLGGTSVDEVLNGFKNGRSPLGIKSPRPS
jgi:hypothetical protein